MHSINGSSFNNGTSKLGISNDSKNKTEKASQKGGGANRSQLCYIDFEIRIQDSGCGISKDNLSKLFMNFSKLDEHSKMNHRGTGLGLSICKSLIELMGGSVRVESELG